MRGNTGEARSGTDSLLLDTASLPFPPFLLVSKGREREKSETCAYEQIARGNTPLELYVRVVVYTRLLEVK